MARVLETWLEDEAPELAQTMARLDRELGRAERFMEGVRRISTGSPRRSEAIGQTIRWKAVRAMRRRRFVTADMVRMTVA